MPKRARTSSMLVLALLALLLVPLTATPASAAPPAVPDSLFPDGQSYSSNPSLTWAAVPTATLYYVDYADNPAFTGKTSITTINTTYAPHQALKAGTWWWRVQARNGSGQLSGFSSPATFEIGLAGPTPTAPANGAVLEYPTEPAAFSWTEVPGARFYEFEWDDASDFVGAAKINSDSNGAILTGTVPFDQQNYWRVRANLGGGIYSEYSAFQTFTLTWPDEPGKGRPTLLSPPYTPGQANPQVTDVELVWAPVLGAMNYQLQISSFEDFSSTIVNVTVQHTRYTRGNTLDNSSGYWWRVRARDRNGNLGPWSAPSAFARAWPASPAQGFPGVGNPPVIVSPANGATVPSPLHLEWEPVDRASLYQVQFDADGIFTSSIDDCNTVKTSLRTPAPGDAPSPVGAGPGRCSIPASGTWYWRVRGIDAPTGVIGLWSAPRTFTLTAPNPPAGAFDQGTVVNQTGPANCESGQVCQSHATTPAMTWDPVPGATHYIVRVAYDESFTNIINNAVGNGNYRVAATENPVLLPRDEWPDNDAGQAYYWHVQACNGGTCTAHPQGQIPPAQSSAFQKRSSPVVLTSPGIAFDPVNPPSEDSIPLVNEMPRFSWEPYLTTSTSGLDAQIYRVQVSSSPQFTPLLDNKEVDQPFFTPHDRTYPEGPTYWRVIGYDGSGNPVSASQINVFRITTPAPLLTYPADDQVLDGVPQFTWELIPHTREYRFELYKNGDQPLSNANRIDDRPTMFNGFTPYDALEPGTYAWRVRGSDAQGKQKPWSAVRKFTIEGYAPDLLSPANGAVFMDDDIHYTWEAEGNPAMFRFQRSPSSNFATITETVDTVQTTWVPRVATANGTWYWRVIALDANLKPMGTSTVRSFVRGAPAQPCATRPFPDVPTTSSFCVDIEWLVDEGIAGGYPDGTFKPTAPVSRQAMAAFLYRYTGQPEPVGACNTTGGFPDVPASHQFCHEIMWMVGEGLSNGYPDGQFKPTNAISRQAMSAFLFRLAGQSEVGACPGTGFPDVPSSHSFCHEVAWMVANDITDGYPDGTFKPTNPISRQAAAAFLHRFDMLP